MGKTRLGENYNWTIYACFIAYVIQAIAGNFAPLLFLTFRNTYGIPIEKISLLITLVFGVQLLVDFLSAVFVSKIGYRTAMIAADCLTAVGFVLLGVLPLRVDPFAGLVTASVVFALGSGLMEVLVSPIVEACPTTRKSAAMSLLHSFYSWGVAGVILLSTAFFALFGIRNWPVLACLWGVVPAVDLLLFLVVPIRSVEETGEKAPARRLFRSGKFWIMMLLMLCAGACEQSVSQWASAFAEAGLGVTKAVGDLADGRFPGVLCKEQRADFAAAVYDAQRRPLPCQLSDGVARGRPGGRPAGMRSLRAFRRGPVARDVLAFRGGSQGRDRDVRAAGAGRRPRLRRRAGLRRHGGGPFRGRPEKGPARGDRFPGAAPCRAGAVLAPGKGSGKGLKNIRKTRKREAAVASLFRACPGRMYDLFLRLENGGRTYPQPVALQISTPRGSTGVEKTIWVSVGPNF